MKRVAAVAVMAALMSVSLVALATAHTVKDDSTITFKVFKNGTTPDTFEGKVSSDRPRCVANRQVLIYREVDGGDDVVVGEAITDANGEYSTPTGALVAGTYYAVVTRKVFRNNDAHKHVCLKAVSRDWVVAGGSPG